MRKVAVVGAGMTRFGKHMDRGLKSLGKEAVDAAMKDAGVDMPQIEAAIVGNATAGLITGQEMIRAQVILRAAALVLVSEEKAKQLTTKPVWVTASILGSGKDREKGEPGVTTRMAKKAYDLAGVGPEDLDVVELHDASAPAELIEYEELGLCKVGDGGKLIEEGVTEITGKIPVNPSGGLLSKGHPIGATGCAQLVEVYWQLQGEASDRQVKDGKAKVGLTQNGGGMMKGEAAAMAVHVLER